jgi:cytochrome d ubiquinol oxidase subunit I
MQHPVGYRINIEKGRAELTDIVEVLTQKLAVATFFHTIPSAIFTGAAVIAGISAWLIVKKVDVEMARPTFKLGAITMMVSFIIIAGTGDYTAKIMTEQQPMKMAAAEALYETTSTAPLSLLTIVSVWRSNSTGTVARPA